MEPGYPAEGQPAVYNVPVNLKQNCADECSGLSMYRVYHILHKICFTNVFDRNRNSLHILKGEWLGWFSCVEKNHIV